ncbi:aspartate-semialdehyde dehydrogenase [Sporosarcina aquimarina]|uniref:Aspartate-semialdehyde dehydrogenase n=1 Tax=Sporosarcina aquimarina TaxID=114975 RepID=A0ABU4G0K2_9BACL|nr:aspartate-semialdehyde dehydrogenase [Sporosarcina aquimarina]MDW0109177.1 aspartate-semialdehyde dehydrogenase [Sporosarcina aquimarina]
MQTYNIAIVGATGAVGAKILDKLIERKFPFRSVKLLASSRSAGTVIQAGGRLFTIEEAKPESFTGVDYAFFSAGGSISEELAPEAVRRGAVVIDNTSAFRMDAEVPLVVPEVNPEALNGHKGLIANPNCSTIQMVVALKPIKEVFGIKKIIVSTYQAVSGAGADAILELKSQSGQFDSRSTNQASQLPSASAERHYPIAFNAIPQIDVFDDMGYTKEEWKMMNETKKIFNDKSIAVSATCVRLPVVTGHSESVYVEIDKDGISAEQFSRAISSSPGIVIQDDPATQTYPMPLFAENRDEVFVGRIRKDPDHPRGFHLWIVADNLLKGAALNSVQIAEELIKNHEEH